MESMSSTFKASLPLNVEEDAELTDRFKDSALAITALFKHAQKSRRSAFVQGYNASITDLRDYIRSNARSSLDQERPLTVGMILDYLEARQAQLLRDLDVSAGPNPSSTTTTPTTTTTAPNRTPTPSTTTTTPTSATAGEAAATASSRSNTPSYKSQKGPSTSSSSTAITPVRSRSGSNSGSGSESRSSRPRTPHRTPRPGDVERRHSTITTAVTSSPSTPRRVPPRSSPSLSPAPTPHERQSWENASITPDENSKPVVGTGWPEVSVLSILPFPPQAYSPTSTYSPTVLPSAGSKRKRDALVEVPMDARNGAVGATATIVGGGGVHLSEHNPFYIAHGGPQKRQSKKRRGTKGRRDGPNGEQGINNSNNGNGEDWNMDMDDDSPTSGNGGARKRIRN